LAWTFECVRILRDVDSSVSFCCARDSALVTGWLDARGLEAWLLESDEASFEIYARMRSNPEPEDSLSVLSLFMKAAFEQASYPPR
jgi:hypothetical protein